MLRTIRADTPLVTVRPLRLLIALGLVLAGIRWVIDSNPLSGPVVMTLSATHGIHTNDWFTLVLWAGAVLVAVPSLLPARGAQQPRLVPVRR